MMPPRLTYLVSKRGPAIVAALLVLGAAGLGVAAWTQANPQTTEITDHENRVTVESSLSTRAVVTGETALYSEGDVVSNQPLYLTEATPTLTLSLDTRLPSKTAGRVDQHVELVYTATRDGDVFWERAETLGGETTRDGRTVSTRVFVSTGDVLRRLSEYRQELGDAASVSVHVRTGVEYDTGRYGGDLSRTIDVRSGPGWVAIPSGNASKTHSTTSTRTVEVGDGDRFWVLAPGGVGALLSLLGLGVAAVYYSVPRREATVDLEADVHRARYADWISRGTLPRDDGLAAVRVDTLEGLVDVAIDTGERVIHDADRGRYAVLRGQTRYYFEPPTRED